MNGVTTLRAQRGATLIIGLIMLVLITLMVLSAFMLSSTNLKSVSNMQYRDEAIGATNVAIEQVISSDAIFKTPAGQTITVGNYSVSVAAPTCLYATEVVLNSSADSNPNSYSDGASGVPGYLDTYWDVVASVNDAMSGAVVETHQGIKITLPSDPNPCP